MNTHETISSKQNEIEWSLFLLRLTVFLVMFVWTQDKLFNPAHGVGIFDRFLHIKGLETSMMVFFGVVEMLVILAFLAGMWKRYTYGLVVIMHGISTLSSWQKYTIDIKLMFFTAWPMLAACIALYLLRDLDVKYTIRRKQEALSD